HDADWGAPTAILDSGQLPRSGHARLRLLPREPAARALPDGGDTADHRFRRAQRAARRPGPRGLDPGAAATIPGRRTGASAMTRNHHCRVATRSPDGRYRIP